MYYSTIFIRLVLVSFCFQFSIVGCHAQLNQTKIEQTLIKALFANYDSEGRPVLNLSEPVLVRFGLAYSNLHSLVCINKVVQSLFSFPLCCPSYQYPLRWRKVHLNSHFHGQCFSFALQCNPTWMRGNRPFYSCLLSDLATRLKVTLFWYRPYCF